MKKRLIFSLLLFTLFSHSLCAAEGAIVNPGTVWNKSIGPISTDIKKVDLDNNGKENLIFGSKNVLYGMKGKKIIWEAYLGENMNREISPSVVDTSHTSEKELLVGAGRIVYLLNSSGGIIWRNSFQNDITSSPKIVKSDNSKYLFLTTNHPLLLNMDGEVESEREDLEARPFLDMEKGSSSEIITGIMELFSLNIPELDKTWSRSGGMSSQVSVANKESQNEIMVFRDTHGNLIALNSEKEVEWREDLDTNFYMGEFPSPSINDIDDDGDPEAVISGYSDRNIYILDANDGNMEKKHEGRQLMSEPVLSDVDGDGKTEAVVTSIGGNTVLSFEYSGKDWTHTIKDIIKTNPLLIDFDGDGKEEILLGTDKGIITLDNVENKPPEAHYTTSKENILPGDDIVFYSSSSSDPEDSKLVYRWNFGKGEGKTKWIDEEKVNQSYLRPGNYTVELEVRDSASAKDRYSKTIRVYEENHPPEADFRVSRTRGTTKTSFEFIATPQDRESPSEELLVRWNFDGDGEWDTNYKTEKTVSHTYDSLGEYNVVLQVKDSGEMVDEHEMELGVEKETVDDREDTAGGNNPQAENNGTNWLLIIGIIILFVILAILVLSKVEQKEEETQEDFDRYGRY